MPNPTRPKDKRDIYFSMASNTMPRRPKKQAEVKISDESISGTTKMNNMSHKIDKASNPTEVTTSMVQLGTLNLNEE